MRFMVMVVLSASLMLTACGRKGNLQPPPGSAEAVEKKPSTQPSLF